MAKSAADERTLGHRPLQQRHLVCKGGSSFVRALSYPTVC